MNEVLYIITRVFLVVYLVLMIYIIRGSKSDASDEWDVW